MDNNYFENLANSIKVSEPKSEEPKESLEATLTVKVDIDCKLYCDGDFLDLFEANKVKKISVPTGQHLFTVESERFNEVSEDVVLEIEQPGKNYLLLVKDLKERENAEVQKREKAKDNERKAAKAEETKRKSEEEQERKKEKSVQEAEECMKKGMEYYNARIYDMALTCFEKVLETSENPEALLFIGKCYEGQDGDDESIRDYEKAITWYRKAAEKGNARAQNNMGNRYFNGKCVGQNYVEAVKWYRKSAIQGYPGAQENLGDCYFNGQGVAQNLGEAFNWYTKAAEQGLAKAQFNLGLCYSEGKGVETDYAKAVEWYTKAAEQGNARAQNNLGWCYLKGEGVGVDCAKAVEWFTKAAEQGNTMAQFNLGWCYRCGKGVETDYAKAVEWYTKAAEKGHRDALCELGLYYDDVSEESWGPSGDFAKAEEWYLKAVNQGYKRGQYRLGWLYFCYSGLRTGRIIVNNTNNAIKWLTEAANQGEADAMENLGYIYGVLCDLDGTGGFDIHSIDDLSVFDACSLSVEWYKKYLETRKDWPTGIYWTTSVLHLARCYQKGDGVEKNLEKARECLESALKILEDFGVSNDGFINRQQDMQRELGLIYEARWMYTGSKEDRKMAIKWYSKAAKNDDEYSKNRLEKM